AGRGAAMSARPAARGIWPPALALAASALAFYPVLAVQFHTDDFLHLYELRNLSGPDFLLKMAGGHLYVTRNAIFLALDALVGADSATAMAVVLATHLFNVWLLYQVVRQLTASPRLACLAAALWGTAPVAVGVLGWYTAYGQALAASCTLWVVWRLAQLADGRPCPPAAPLRWALLLVAAGASFALGIATTAVMPVVAWLLLPPSPARRRIVVCFALAVIALAVGYLFVEQLNVARHGAGTSAMVVELGTRTPLSTLRLFVHLLAAGAATLTLGPLFALADYPTPAALAAAAACAAAVVAAFIVAPPRGRRQIAACLVLALAAYAIIAAGRGVFHTNILPSVRQPRYHYAAPLWLVPALALALQGLAGGRPRQTAARTALFAAGVAALGASVAAGRPIDCHEAVRDQVAGRVAALRDAILRQPPGSDVFLANRPFDFSTYIDEFPGSAALFVVYFPDNVVEGRQVYFVELAPRVLALARNGQRSRALLVPPAPGRAVVELP
ncbi:MAG: hypothetical protein ACRERC_21430, partial [Candidatus Binatia bacterium]